MTKKAWRTGIKMGIQCEKEKQSNGRLEDVSAEIQETVEKDVSFREAKWRRRGGRQYKMTKMKGKLSGRLIRRILNNNRKMSKTKECKKMRRKL